MSDLSIGGQQPLTYDPRDLPSTPQAGGATGPSATPLAGRAGPTALTAADGIDAASTAGPNTTAAGSGRELPDIAAEPGAAEGKAAIGKGMTWALGGDYNLAAALSLLVETAAQRAEGASRSQQLQNRAATSVSTQKAEEVAKEVAGQRESAITNFAVSIGAAAASMGASGLGGSLSTTTAKVVDEGAFAANAAGQQAFKAAQDVATKSAATAVTWGVMLQASGQSLGASVNAAGTMGDKLSGGGYAEGQAKIAQSNLDVLLAIYKNNDEGLKNETQEANRSWSQLLEMRDKVIDRQNSVMMSAAQF